MFAGLSVNGVGCASQPSGLSGSTGSSQTTSGTGGSGGGMTAPDPKPLFDALEPDLVAACGSCHEPGGVADRPFLAPPDRYQSIISWPGVITKPSTNSILLTHPISGSSHPGKNLDAPDLKTTLYPKVQAWLAAEAAAIANPVDMQKAQIAPIAPIMGFNAIYLDALDPSFAGMAITFNADALTNSTIKLSDIEVHTTTKEGIHIVHPIFVVYPVAKMPDPDPVDSFNGFDSFFAQDTSTTLGPGTLLLDNWAVDGKLSIVFEKIELYTMSTGNGGGGSTSSGSGCKALTDFTTSAAPQFQQRCFGCHGGANAMAMAAVDMSQLMSNAGVACAQIKARVKPTDAANSQIFITTDPAGNAAHPFKFGGSTTQFNSFKTTVSTWITKEM